MINVTLKHLRYFDALARYGHFGRAAEACAISQPAMSVQIKELETILGSALVERSAREIRLTTLGEEFLGRARKILSEVEDLADLARKPDGPLKGRLRMGVIPTVAPYLLPAIIRRLSVTLPELELRPRETVTQVLLQDLMQTRLDFVIAALPVPSGLNPQQPLIGRNIGGRLADAQRIVPGPIADEHVFDSEVRTAPREPMDSEFRSIWCCRLP